jgi:hypothetical protein
MYRDYALIGWATGLVNKVDLEMCCFDCPMEEVGRTKLELDSGITGIGL